MQPVYHCFNQHVALLLLRYVAEFELVLWLRKKTYNVIINILLL